MAKRKVGDGLCDCCGRDVVWKEADGGSVSYTCQHCDWRGYAPNGTEAKRLALAMMKKTAPPSAPVAEVAEPAIEQATNEGGEVKEKTKSFFEFP